MIITIESFINVYPSFSDGNEAITVIRSHGTPKSLNKIVNLFFNQIQEKKMVSEVCNVSNKRVAGRVFSVWESEDDASRDAVQREDGVLPPSALQHLLLTASLGPEHQPRSQPLSHPASAPQEAVSATLQTPCPETCSSGMARS